MRRAKLGGLGILAVTFLVLISGYHHVPEVTPSGPAPYPLATKRPNFFKFPPSTVVVPLGTALQNAAGNRAEVIYDPKTGNYTVEKPCYEDEPCWKGSSASSSNDCSTNPDCTSPDVGFSGDSNDIDNPNS